MRRMYLSVAVAASCVGSVVGVSRGQSAEVEIDVPSAGSFQWIPITATLRLSNLGASGLAVLRGSVVVTDNFGNATGMVQGFSSQFSGPPSNLGTFSGLSRVGISIGSLPPGYPSGTYTIGQWQIMPDQPGQVFYARWVPEAGYEQVRVHLSPTLPAIVPIPTANLSEVFYVGGCCPPPFCRADLTGTATPGQSGYGIPNLSLNSEDFFFFLNRYSVGDRNRCDLTTTSVPGPGYGIPNGLLNSEDFFYYLTIYAQGC